MLKSKIAGKEKVITVTKKNASIVKDVLRISIDGKEVKPYAYNSARYTLLINAIEFIGKGEKSFKEVFDFLLPIAIRTDTIEGAIGNKILSEFSRKDGNGKLNYVPSIPNLINRNGKGKNSTFSIPSNIKLIKVKIG